MGYKFTTFYYIIALLLCGVFLFQGISHAACSSPVGQEGQITYNTTHKVMMFCDGTHWWSMKESGNGGSGGIIPCVDDDTTLCSLQTDRSSNDPDFIAANIANGVDVLGVTGTNLGSQECTAPATCPNVGDVCSDGSLFAGFMVYNNSTCEALYVTDSDQPNSQWKTSSGIYDITAMDVTDGKVNAANRSGHLMDFPAFNVCESSIYHGKSDWYLPAQKELELLFMNKAAINMDDSVQPKYWSSNEQYIYANYAFYVTMSSGGTNPIMKTSGAKVRCVRRD